MECYVIKTFFFCLCKFPYHFHWIPFHDRELREKKKEDRVGLCGGNPLPAHQTNHGTPVREIEGKNFKVSLTLRTCPFLFHTFLFPQSTPLVPPISKGTPFSCDWIFWSNHNQHRRLMISVKCTLRQFPRVSLIHYSKWFLPSPYSFCFSLIWLDLGFIW